MPAIELTESVSGASTTLALRKNSADSPSLLERGGVRSGGSASVASSVFNLANTIMGTGMLALPHAFATAGLASGLALCVVSAAANAFTNHLLTAASHRIEGTSLPAMAEAALPFWGGLVPAGSYFFLMPHEKWSAKRIGALVTLVAGIVLLPTCVAMVFIDT